MATLPQILVNGDANMATWIGTYTQIDEPTTAPVDTDYVRSPIGPDSAAFFIQDMPSDFDTMTTLTCSIRYSQFGRSDDSMGLFCQMYAADGTTPLTDEVTVNANITSTAWVTANVTFTGVVPGDKTTWDGARLRFRTSYTQNMGKDGSFEIRVSAVHLGGTYVSVAPPVAKTASDTLSISLTEAAPAIEKSIDKTASDTLSISATEVYEKSVIGIVAEENFEDTSYNLTFGATNDWIRTNAQAQTGSWSWTNPVITHSQQTDSIIIVPEGATSIKFWYMVSSEASWDFFRFFIDGVQQFQAAGTVAWTQVTYDVTQGQLLTFRYFKDGSQSVGADAAFVDNITFEGFVGPPPIPQSGSDPLNITVVDVSTLITAIEQITYPSAVLTQTNITGAVTDIDEDPASPDANWMLGSGAITLRLAFPSPDSNLEPGMSQKFHIRVRPGA